MNLWTRFLLYLISILRHPPKRQTLETSILEFRVLPSDLDVNLHMNNGRYLSLMDLGRLDLMVGTGLAKLMLKKRWRPILAGASIDYRRELRPFRKFELHTRILGWDGRWFFIEQKFFQGESLCAEAVVRALLIGPEGSLNGQELAEAAGHSGPSPEIPHYVLQRFTRMTSMP